VKVGALWPPDTGGRLRSFHLLSELAQRHRVTLVTTHGPGDDPDTLASRLPGLKRLISVPYAIPKRGSAAFAWALSRSWVSGLPVDMLKLRVAAVSEEVRHHLVGGRVDVCIADFLSAMANVPTSRAVPVVLFAHNVEHMIWKRLSEVDGRLWSQALLELEWRKMRRYEARACARATVTVAVSDADRDRLADHAPGAAVRTIPTGVDTSYFAPDGHHDAPASVVFVGSMDWFPNEDAVVFFVDFILPRIRAGVPEVTVAIVGRNPSSRLMALAPRHKVRVTGTVADVRPFLGSASVCVVPLRIGGGTRLKIFEALAMGKAVVSTTIGAEGLPLTPGAHFLQADDPQDFADAVVSLLRDPARRRALGSAGRMLVASEYSWPQVAAQFEAVCREAAVNRAH
jgi:sugar transferase (PEP-CTERM/EpsH1 system associated)